MMRYRKLGRTGLKVSEIGLGAEWLERHNEEEVRSIIDECGRQGINIMDVWMSEPNVRTNIGNAIEGKRKDWIIEGHIGSTWQDGQYVRTRDLDKVKPAFEDLLVRLKTDHIDLGMIHYVDGKTEFEKILNSPYLDYVQGLKKDGVISHIGMSSHNPIVAKMAVESGIVEMILFSINPAFDMLPPSEDLETCFAEEYDPSLDRIAPEREELYTLCESRGVGINVMKGYAGGRLFSSEASPFGVALTPVQCLCYALTRPAVASVMAGFDTPLHVSQAVAYETASDEEKDYLSVLKNAPKHSYGNGQCTYCGHCAPCPQRIDIAMVNKFYDLATMQKTVPESVRSHYEALERNASDCIGCHGCEKRCPFNVPIVEKMKKTAQLFG
jgi:uncharacterized protein